MININFSFRLSHLTTSLRNVDLDQRNLLQIEMNLKTTAIKSLRYPNYLQYHRLYQNYYNSNSKTRVE